MYILFGIGGMRSSRLKDCVSEYIPREPWWSKARLDKSDMFVTARIVFRYVGPEPEQESEAYRVSYEMYRVGEVSIVPDYQSAGCS